MALCVARTVALCVVLLLGCTAAGAAAQSDADWRVGRATHYSAPGDQWTIHDGSCTHKYIWPDIGPGGWEGSAVWWPAAAGQAHPHL